MRDIEAFPPHLTPDLADAIDLVVLLPDTFDLGLQRGITTDTVRQPSRIGTLRQVIIVGGRGDRQHRADRPSPLGSNQWRLNRSAPCASLCASRKSTITSTGGRAPPSQNRSRHATGSSDVIDADALRRISFACRSSRFSRSKAFVWAFEWSPGPFDRSATCPHSRPSRSERLRACRCRPRPS